ncbi:MAG TPA: ParB/RepB/Spo0J family partition protein [Erysipelotrichaceae bacterium]|jgi:ParB family chromosome partitioning protein|nr:ParB/RepB/Spo0J family partition protein [Erysipelotrichaceae bacterium]HQB31923.1 ParB/RepB/Spo0J family partition protein [Erysipelotrichaceae bacterium]
MAQYQLINIDEIKPNQYQPRTSFDKEAIEELAVSIKENGLIQPITVRESYTGYELIVGERRYRACKSLGHKQINAFVIRASEVQAATLAIIENIQREDLSPIEEANGYLQMIRLTGLTQQQLANKVGKKQTTISNKIRLLNLCHEVQEAINSKQITERHGRALLSLDEKQQKEVLQSVLARDLNVKETENLIDTNYFKPKKKKKGSIKCFGISAQLIINSFRDTFKKAKEFDRSVMMTEQDQNEDYIITITIKK